MERILEYLNDLLLAIYHALVDAIDAFLPSTPTQYQIGSMLAQLPTESFTYYFLIECASVVFVVLGLVVGYKLIKILPLT